jgi:hypothetical protein
MSTAAAGGSASGWNLSTCASKQVHLAASIGWVGGGQGAQPGTLDVCQDGVHGGHVQPGDRAHAARVGSHLVGNVGLHGKGAKRKKTARHPTLALLLRCLVTMGGARHSRGCRRRRQASPLGLPLLLRPQPANHFCGHQRSYLSLLLPRCCS